MEKRKTILEEHRVWVHGVDLRTEAREDDESGGKKLVGYASLFNREANIGGWFREVIKPGAFTRAIKEKQDVRALVDHNSSMILGRTKAGTLELRQDDKGLLTTITPPDTQLARDLMENVRVGNIDQMSFGFLIRKQVWTEGDSESLDLREIEDVDLFDVSVVTYPAYEETEVSLRNAKQAFEQYKGTRITDKEFNETLAKRLEHLEL